uniref:Ig-like domain-containing protein n=1 Tax=Peromyscus maniculatus bairdii TaxID=230844 RepID=A0A8C8UQ78_PERMB
MTFTFTALLRLGWLPWVLDVLFLAGALPKPVLTVQPDSVVYMKTTVTFLCEGTTGAKVYRLYRDGYQYLRHTENPQNPKNKAEFSISKITHHQAGQYHCQYQTRDGWSEYSDALELVVTAYSKSSLSARPIPMVTEGENVTLQCASWQQYDRFILMKEGPQRLFWTLDSQYNFYTRQFQALFSVGPVTSNQRWTFRCYSFNKYRPQLWSEPSEPLELLVSGQLPFSPSLSVKPNSTVHSGDNVTLLCQSTDQVDTFILSKEGAAHQPQPLKSKFQVQEFQAEFSMSAVTSDISGTYRCYGSQDSSPYLLSHASAPVELTVLGEVTMTPQITSVTSLSTTTASEIQDHTVENLIRMGFAAMILTVLGILVFEAWGSQRRAQRAAEK